MKVVVAREFKSAREQLYSKEEEEYEDEEAEEEEDEEVEEGEEAEAGAEGRRRGRRRRRRQNWIRPAPRASGLRPQLDSVVFPPHMRSVKKKKIDVQCKVHYKEVSHQPFGRCYLRAAQRWKHEHYYRSLYNECCCVDHTTRTHSHIFKRVYNTKHLLGGRFTKCRATRHNTQSSVLRHFHNNDHWVSRPNMQGS